MVRCLSMADGKDVWRWSYAVDIRPNHGITRTVPSVGEQLVFSLDPKCRFHALDVKTGKLVWQKNLVQEYKATIPGWYAGQNPLLDGDRVVLATGGDALAVAFDQATGKEIWRSPNPGKDVMSHGSLMPATIGGVKQYLYLTMNKVVGIAAADGQILWSIPFADQDGRRARRRSRLATAGCSSRAATRPGSMMIQVEKGASGFTAKKLYDLTSAQFNSEVHTPILYKNHLFARRHRRRAAASCASASTARSCGRARSRRATRPRRGRSNSAASCSPTACSSCVDGKSGHAAPDRGEHDAVQGTGERAGPGRRGRLGPARRSRTASS